jgi:aminomethyltransferase
MKKTPLFENHVALGAKMGPFAGYDMPIVYKDGVVSEHEWVRSSCGLFDVSHMRQVVISGQDAMRFVEKITPSSYEKAPTGRAKYTVLTNESGGIVDDLIVTRMGESEFFAVINAGCRDKDVEWMNKHLGGDVKIDCLDERALIAVQGPWAESVLSEYLGQNLSEIPYMWLQEMSLPGSQSHIYISRVGYTGEDGFEISLPESSACELWEGLLAHDKAAAIGLAARDSLRLEMGYCLYGHDIDDKTTPVEADLSWVIGKNNTEFLGAEIIRSQLEEGTDRKRVGIMLTGQGIAREGSVLKNKNSEVIGVMTSGGFSPSLKKSIGQGYVSKEYSESGTEIFVEVRGRLIEAVVSKMPFMQANTKSMKRQAA